MFESDQRIDPSWSDYANSMARMISSNTFYQGHDYDYEYCTPERRGVPSSSIPEYPKINNLNSLLHDVYLRYIAINDEDFETYYNIVNDIFLQMHKKMKEVDMYYAKYSSTVQFVGSHPDRLRINKPDEFDIDIVMKMPLNFRSHPFDPRLSDFLLQPSDPGYMQLKMGKQYQCLPKRDPYDWRINSRAHRWKDDEYYLLPSKFLDWFKSVVTRALNQFIRDGTPTFYVAGAPFTVRRSESGPAMTLYIENKQAGIKLDIDLVVGLRFPIDRWPNDGRYRAIPAACVHNVETTYWMLVPKMIKGGSEQDAARSWRIAMHQQERMLMHDTKNLRQTIRLMKKLRDSQFMNKLSSYYIKTIFFWEIARLENDKSFWNQSPAYLFTHMLKILYLHLRIGNIPFFWNPSNNPIAEVHHTTLKKYTKIVGELIEILENPSRYMEATKYLLFQNEYEEYEQLLKVSPVKSFFTDDRDLNLFFRLFKFSFVCLFALFVISMFGK